MSIHITVQVYNNSPDSFSSSKTCAPRFLEDSLSSLREITLDRCCYFRSFSFSHAAVAVNSIFSRSRAIVSPDPGNAECREDSPTLTRGTSVKLLMHHRLPVGEILLIASRRENEGTSEEPRTRERERDLYKYKENSISRSHGTEKERFLSHEGETVSLSLISM